MTALNGMAAGRAAAGIMGFSRPEHVWRAVAAHGDDYSGPIDIVEVGRTKAAPREQLAAFAVWYEQNVRGGAGRREPARPQEPVEVPAAPVAAMPDPAAVMAERRAKLRAAIERIEARWAREEVYEW